MKLRPSEGVGLLLLGAAAVLVVLVGIVHEFAPYDQKSAYDIWTGGKGALGLLTSIATPIVAGAAAWLAYRSYRMNQRGAVASRFQKGAELMDAASDSSRIGGIELLSAVALEDPGGYQTPVIRTLRQLLAERSWPVADQIYKLRPRDTSPDPRNFDRSGLVVTAAFGAICRTPDQNRWGGLEYDRGLLRIRGLYLHRARMEAANLSRLHLVAAVFGEVVFRNCTFNDVRIECRCFDNISFERCTINRLVIFASDMLGEAVEVSNYFATVRCSATDFYINNSTDVPEEAFVSDRRTDE